MRKRYRVLAIAAVVAAVAVPFGFGFSLESNDDIRMSPESAIAATVATSTMVAVDLRSTPATDSDSRTIADSAKLIAIGTLLFGVAAVVRKRA